MNTAFTVPADREIRSVRIFDFPAATVFRAWSDQLLLQRWWGPAGFTNTFHEFSFRPGGTWRFTMHGPEAGHYENEVVYHTIDAPRLIVWDRVSKPLFRVVATFKDAGQGRTELVFRMQFETMEDCEKIRRFAVDKNEENFDRLEAVLQEVKRLESAPAEAE